MKHLVFILSILFLIIIGCSKDENPKPSPVGIWTQTVGDSTYWFTILEGQCNYQKVPKGADPYNYLGYLFPCYQVGNDSITILKMTPVAYELWLSGTFDDKTMILNGDHLHFKLSKHHPQQ